MKTTLVKALMLSALIPLSGCMMAKGVHETWPTAHKVNRSSKAPSQIDVYTQTNPPRKPVVYIANVAAHGNGYADNNTLVETLKSESAKVGADFVLITEKEISNDETVGTYSGGIMMSNQIRRPHLYGIAGVYSKVSLGLHAKDDGTIAYVASGSCADNVGLKEGMRILTINGTYFSNTMVLQQEVCIKKPGDTITLEYLGLDGKKANAKVVLKPSK